MINPFSKQVTDRQPALKGRHCEIPERPDGPDRPVTLEFLVD
jgi:hypothetical protein